MTLSAPAFKFQGNSGVGQNYATASSTITNGALVLVFVATGKAGNLAEAPTSVTHPAIGSLTKVLSIGTPTNNCQLSIWKGYGTGVAGAFTINHGNAMDNCLWQVAEFTSDVAPPTVRSNWGTNTSSPAGTVAASLSSSPLAGSCTVGAMTHNSTDTGTTVGAGFTAIGTRASRSSPTIALWSEYDNTSPPSTADFTFAATSGKAVAVLEVDDGVVVSGPTAKVWNGTAEVNATLSVWNGSAEVPLTIS